MCCPTGSGCGGCGGSNNSGSGAVGGESGRSQVTIAQELGSIALIVRGFFFSGGDWIGMLSSMRNWENHRVGHCGRWMCNLVNCFHYCSGGAVSCDELRNLLQELSDLHGGTAVLLALDRLSADLEAICHKPKEEVENILKPACERAAADIGLAERLLIQNEADESSLLDPELRDPVQLCSLIQQICAAVGLVDVITQPPIYADDEVGASGGASGPSGARQ